MHIDKGLEFLFAQPGAKRWLTRSRAPRAAAILPATTGYYPEKGTSDFIYSTDPRALALKARLADRLSDEFPTDVLPSGFAGPSSVPGDFYSLRNVSGIGMDPLPIPVTDNAALIKQYGLADSIRPEDEPWLKEIVRLFFGHAVPSNLHIRKAASTGFPYFTSDNTYKKMAALQTLVNADDFLNAMTGDSRGLEYAMKQYHSLCVYAIQERQQPNAISKQSDGTFTSKPRTAPTEDEARSGRYDGKTIADMTARDEKGNVLEGHFAMRRRDVFGGNGPVNYFLTAIFGCFREVYLNRFAATYKSRGAADKQQKIARFKYVVGSDVKTMDKMVPRWFTMFVMKELEKYLDGRVVELMRRAYQAPYVCPPPWQKTPESFNPVFGESPLDPKSFTMHVGLPSGIAFNPDWGKLWMTFVYSVLYKDVRALVSPAELEGFLSGKHPDHALQDTADDAAFLTNVAAVAERLKKPSSPYAVLEVETPVVYLGDVYCEVGGEKKVYPNPLTYIINGLCREDSIDRNPVTAWAEGVIARMHVYSANPIFRDLNAIYEEEARKHLGFNPNLIARTLAVRQRYNDVDALVKASPSVLHYKIDPKDVSPEILDEVVATVPAADWFNKVRHLFLCPTTTVEAVKDYS